MSDAASALSTSTPLVTNTAAMGAPMTAELRAVATMPPIAEWALPLPATFKRHHYDLGLAVLQQTMGSVRQHIRDFEAFAANLELKARDMKQFASRKRGPDVDRLTCALEKRCFKNDRLLPPAQLAEALAVSFPWCPADQLLQLVQETCQDNRWHVLADMLESMSDQPVNTRLFVWMDALFLCSVLRRFHGEATEGEAEGEEAETEAVEDAEDAEDAAVDDLTASVATATLGSTSTKKGKGKAPKKVKHAAVAPAPELLPATRMQLRSRSKQE